MVNALLTLAIYLVPMLGGAALASSRRYEHFRQELQLREHERQLESALIQERRRLAESCTTSPPTTWPGSSCRRPRSSD